MALTVYSVVILIFILVVILIAILIVILINVICVFTLIHVISRRNIYPNGLVANPQCQRENANRKVSKG